MNTIQAIKTFHNGYYFRSRTEARQAVFYDSFDEYYEYEPEGWPCPTRWYLIDFLIPRLEFYHEVKGTEPTDEEIKLCEEVYHITKKAVVVSWGTPTKAQNVNGVFKPERLRVYADGRWWNECFWAMDKQQKLCICNNSSVHLESTCPGLKSLDDITDSVDEWHVYKARSANFDSKKRQEALTEVTGIVIDRKSVV